MVETLAKYRRARFDCPTGNLWRFANGKRGAANYFAKWNFVSKLSECQ
jgi:hypothetical protein